MPSLFILSAFLFYYIGKGIFPQLLTGKIIVPIFFLLALILLIIKAGIKKDLISRKINLFFIILTLSILFLYAGTVFTFQDKSRFETSLTLYFATFIFFLFFYGLFFFTRFEFKQTIIVFIILFTLDTLIELWIVKTGRTNLMVHYASNEVYNLERFAQTTRVVGLLGNRSNTATFMVTLFWFFMSFQHEKLGRSSKVLLGMLALSFTICLSGTAFFVLLISIMFYSRKHFLLVLTTILPMSFVLGSLFLFASKIGIYYMSYIILYKLSFFNDFIHEIYQKPSMLLFGTPSAYAWSVYADTAYLKAITDFGIIPIIINFYFLRMVLKNFKSLNLSKHSYRCLSLGIWSLIIGTMHYPVLFSIPVQAFLGALAAYSFHLVSRHSIQRFELVPQAPYLNMNNQLQNSFSL